MESHNFSQKQNLNRAQDYPLSTPGGCMGRGRYVGGLAWLWVTTNSKDLTLSLRQAPEKFKQRLGG